MGTWLSVSELFVGCRCLFLELLARGALERSQEWFHVWTTELESLSRAGRLLGRVCRSGQLLQARCETCGPVGADDPSSTEIEHMSRCCVVPGPSCERLEVFHRRRTRTKCSRGRRCTLLCCCKLQHEKLLHVSVKRTHGNTPNPTNVENVTCKVLPFFRRLTLAESVPGVACVPALRRCHADTAAHNTPGGPAALSQHAQGLNAQMHETPAKKPVQSSRSFQATHA